MHFIAIEADIIQFGIRGYSGVWSGDTATSFTNGLNRSILASTACLFITKKLAHTAESLPLPAIFVATRCDGDVPRPRFDYKHCIYAIFKPSGIGESINPSQRTDRMSISYLLKRFAIRLQCCLTYLAFSINHRIFRHPL